MGKIKKALLLFTFLVVLGGCSSAAAELQELPTEQENLTSWTNRSSGFGNSSYTASEDEALADLDTRFDVELRPNFSVLEDLALAEMDAEAYVVSDPEYTINASGADLYVADRITFSEEDSVMAYSDITDIFLYVEDREQVKVSNETFEMSFWTGKGEYIGKDFPELVKNVGEIFAIPESDLASGIEKIENSAEYSNQEIRIYDTVSAAQKSLTFGHQLIVEFGENGVPAKLTASWFDYRV